MSVLRVTEGVVEINATHQGDVEIVGGVVMIRGRVTGDVDIRGGKSVVTGIVDGSIHNLGGHVQISGTVLGTITGAPSHTVVDITDGAQSTFDGWDPIAAAQPAQRSRQLQAEANQRVVMSTTSPDANKSSAGRATILSALAATVAGVATIVALALAGGNTPVDADGVNSKNIANATVLVAEKN